MSGLTAVGVDLAAAWEMVWCEAIRAALGAPTSIEVLTLSLDRVTHARGVADALDEKSWREADGLRLACLHTLTSVIAAGLRHAIANADGDMLPALTALQERARALEQAWTRTRLRIEQLPDYQRGFAADLLGCDPDRLVLGRGGDT